MLVAIVSMYLLSCCFTTHCAMHVLVRFHTHTLTLSSHNARGFHCLAWQFSHLSFIIEIHAQSYRKARKREQVMLCCQAVSEVAVSMITLYCLHRAPLTASCHSSFYLHNIFLGTSTTTTATRASQLPLVVFCTVVWTLAGNHCQLLVCVCVSLIC